MVLFSRGVQRAGCSDSTMAAPVAEWPVMKCVRPGRPVESWVSLRGRGSVMVVLACLLFFSLFLLFLFGEVGWFAVCYGGMLERLPLLQVCSVVGRGDCLRKYSVQRSLSFLSGGDDWPK